MIQTIAVGPIIFHTYGLIIGTAMVVGWWYATRLFKDAKIPEALFERFMWVSIVLGVIGARAYHVIDYWWFYQHSIGDVLAVWRGGLGIWGAVIGGLIGLWFSTLKYRQFRWKLLDIFAMTLPLSQAIGRWGNYVNYELFGKPTQLPWKLFVPESYRPVGYEGIAFYHPLFMYESLLTTLLFIFLFLGHRNGWKTGNGILFGGYLVGYGFIRFILEPLRINPWHLGALYTAQVFSLIAIAIGGLIIYTLRKRVDRE